MKKMTIKDIASEAGVSKATVSRVLNHGEIVDEKTRKKVEKIMEKYNYTPSTLARNLSNQASNTIGIIIPEIDNSFYGKILRTIVNMADSKGFVPICLDTDNRAEKDIKALTILKDQQVGGIIYAPSTEYGEKKDEAAVKDILSNLNVPVVLLDRKVSAFGRNGVYFQNYEAGYRCTKILLAAGHKRIGVIGGNNKIGIARERLDGYIGALNEYGVKVDKKYIFEGDFTAETSYQLSKKLLGMEERPTAVVTFNNTTGLGYMQAFTEIKKEMTDLKIEHMGYDEIDALDFLHIPYNHVVRSRRKMGAKAMELLLSQMERTADNYSDVYIEPQYSLDNRLKKIAARAGII